MLGYDAAGRLYQTSSPSAGAGAGAATTRFGYDGINLIAEYDATNAMVRRYVHGPGSDEPIVWYEGGGTNDRRYMLRDARGSITSITNGSGAVIAINSYDGVADGRSPIWHTRRQQHGSVRLYRADMVARGGDGVLQGTYV